MKESIIEHYMSGLGRYPSNPSGLNAFFEWHKKAFDLWIDYEKFTEIGKATKAFIKSGGHEILFPPGSKYSKMNFSDGQIYVISDSNEQGVFLRQESQIEISVFFKRSDVILIDFDFNFSHYQ